MQTGERVIMSFSNSKSMMISARYGMKTDNIIRPVIDRYNNGVRG